VLVGVLLALGQDAKHALNDAVVAKLNGDLNVGVLNVQQTTALLVAAALVNAVVLLAGGAL